MNMAEHVGNERSRSKSLAYRAESRRNRLIRIGDVFMKIEIFFADADSVAWQAATLIAAEAPTAVAERDRFIIAVSGVIGITNVTQTI
jgi:hypothetical protein